MNRILIFTLSLLITAGCINAYCQKTFEYKFQDPSLATDLRVADLISHMTLEEKVNQLFNAAPAIPRLGIPAYNWWNESLHGVARAGKATVFPQAIGLAATFDESLMLKVATAVSDEARAKHHDFVRNNVRSIYTGLTFWTPNINIFRDPRWGRGQETYGEDPYLTGRMAVNFIKGLQSDHPKYFKTIATAKHYAVHSGPEFTRHSENTFVNDRDLYETYLPAFKVAVKEANVQSVMCAYNRFRDKPCCGSDYLLSTILRNEFGFSGYVVSDCGAITDFYKKENHHVVETPEQAWGWAVASGTDLNCEECPAFINDNLDSAVQTGIINEKDINTSLSRLFNARFKLGMFDPEDQVAYSKIPMTVVGSEKHLKLTQEAAEKSLVLLMNNGVLPLKNVKKIALIGPNADNPVTLIGNYAGLPVNPSTPLEALRKRLGAANVFYTPGSPIVPGIYTNYEIVGSKNLFHLKNGKLQPGLQAEYFENGDLSGEPKIKRVDPSIDFHWTRSPINNLVEEEFSVRWSGVLVPQKSGIYNFSGNYKFDGNGNVQSDPYGVPSLRIDGEVIDVLTEVTLEKGKQYKLDVQLSVAPFMWANLVEPSATLYWVEAASRDYRKEALEAANKAEVIIFCGGISPRLEGEEMKLETTGFAHGDRTDLALPGVQLDLLKELHKTGKPIVYVNFSGSAIALNWEDENLSAIVQAFYPGEAAGNALASLIMGDFSPSGRLPITFYKSVDDLPPFNDYSMAGRTYRYFEGDVLYPFGYGLSYTTFKYDNLNLPAKSNTSDLLTGSIDVTNVGNIDAREIIQVYLSSNNNDENLPMPIRSLVNFYPVMIKAGETLKVEFTITPDQFSHIDKNYERVIEPGIFEISIGGGQPDEMNFSGVLGKVQIAN